MNVSQFCIRHPVATILMSLALTVSGLFAYRFIPVAALPSVEYPVINVSASLPGASPDTMATSVATPLIKQFATIAGIDTMSASSSNGSTSITIQFALGRDIDAAANDVQSAIARSMRRLPADMVDPPSYRKVNPADAPILLMNLTSDVLQLSKLDEFAESVVSPVLATIDGVAQVQVLGGQKFAVRIQVDPTALAARGIGVDELQSAVSAANANTPVGTLQNDTQSMTIEARTQIANAEQFANVIIATRNGRPVRLGDVAKVIDSVENTKTASWHDGARSILLAVQRQPDANTVAVVDRIKAMLPTLEKQMPQPASLSLLNDRSTSIRDAVHDVQFTLGLIVALVVLVIFLFLRRAMATTIAAVAVPISLIATLGAMYLMDYSIDNISLLGLTLAVGLVVDDAIVMLENIVRHMEEEGRSAFEAALEGAKEIGFTIIAISLSLVAVFIPLLLMGGTVGLIFREFAVVVTVSILASAFVSLTLTPMMCARLLKAVPRGQGRITATGPVDRRLAQGFDYIQRGYERGLAWAIQRRPLMLGLFFATVLGTVWLVYVSPKGFFPQEDIGQMTVSTQARQDISFEAMSDLQNQVAAIFRKSPYVDHLSWSVGSGSGGLNSGQMFVQLKPRSERPDIQKVLADLRRETAQVAGIRTFMTPIQNLRLGGRSSKSQYQFVMQGLNQKELFDWSVKMADAMGKDRSNFADISSDLQNSATQASLIVDRDKANMLGVSSDVLRSTLYSGFGARQVSTIYSTGDNYSVLIEFDPSIAWTADRLDLIRVRAKNGALIPVSSFARIETTTGPLTVNQLGQIAAVTISFNLPEGVALGQSVARLDALKAEIKLPQGITTTFTGTAKTFNDSLANQGLLIVAAIVTIYIVLGILYESFIHPLTILSGLPSAVFGALLALWVFRLDLSVIAIIGVLMLIGLVKKNAIMMIDVALVLQRQGMAAADAIYKACAMRFRPIMMTTCAALIGTLPIALGAGASSELRQPLGVAVVGGLIVSQVITLFITPVLYLYMDRLAQWAAPRELPDAPASADAFPAE
jgi:HAE1 family hydrophobic/amphiphilic exporter-1